MCVNDCSEAWILLKIYNIQVQQLKLDSFFNVCNLHKMLPENPNIHMNVSTNLKLLS